MGWRCQNAGSAAGSKAFRVHGSLCHASLRPQGAAVHSAGPLSLPPGAHQGAAALNGVTRQLQRAPGSASPAEAHSGPPAPTRRRRGRRRESPPPSAAYGASLSRWGIGYALASVGVLPTPRRRLSGCGSWRVRLRAWCLPLPWAAISNRRGVAGVHGWRCILCTTHACMHTCTCTIRPHARPVMRKVGGGRI